MLVTEHELEVAQTSYSWKEHPAETYPVSKLRSSSLAQLDYYSVDVILFSLGIA